MKIAQILPAIVAGTFLIAALGGCKPEPGPAERAGEKIDRALGTQPKEKTLGERAGEKVEQAGENIQDAAKK